MKQNKNQIAGSGGGGKRGGSAPTEVADNQFTDVIAKVLVAYSSGQTDGIIGGRKGVFLDQTQLESEGGSQNFGGVAVTERTGATVQGSIPGFEEAKSVVNIATELENGSPVIRTVSGDEIDAVRIIVTLPALQNINTNGDILGTSVQIKFEVRDPGTGVWEDRGTKTISGKSSGPFQRAYTIAGPSTITDAWDWRATRLTAASTSARLQNDTTLQSSVEIQYGKQTYPDTAYVGMEFDISDFGTQLPQIAFRVSGVRVRVPVNYNETGGAGGTPSYTGVWNGTWKWASTSNPVWHLYHLIIDDQVGLGLPETYVDRYNFYEAARYCDAVDDEGIFVGVPDGSSGVRRRFTINTQISGQKDGIELLQDIASSMRAIVYFGAGAIVLKQDRPRETSRIITNENVLNGVFAYSSSSARDRITVAKVGYNDPDDFFKFKYVRFPEESEWATDTNIARYGRNEIEVTKFGCANEAEAKAYAQWLVYTSCNETRTVTFTGGPEMMLLRPGDVIEVADRRLAGASNLDQRFGGRIAGGDTLNLTLDYPIDLAVGETYTVTIVDSDGKTLVTRDVTNTAADGVTSLSVSPAFPNAPVKGYSWLVTGTDIAPQKFSVINIERKEGLEVEIFAIQYDENKFLAVEASVALVDKPYTRIDITDIEPPTNLTYQLVPRLDPTRGVYNSLIVRWTASDSQTVSSYRARFRRANGEWTNIDNIRFNEFQIDDVLEGTYEVAVYSRNALGYQSVPLEGTYDVVYGDATYEWEGNLVTIQPPDFTGGTEFTTKDLVVTWERDSANDIPGIVFKQYEVEFWTDSTLRRKFTTTETTATYYYDDMVGDQGENPSRTVEVRVREQNALLHESAQEIRTYTNPAPLAPTFTLTETFDQVFIDIQPPSDPDIVGYIVCQDATTGFTPSDANVVYKGPDPRTVDINLTGNTEYFYRVAAYDTFDDTVANLNFASQQSATPTVIDTEIIDYEFAGITVTESSNVVSWTAGTVYVREAGTVNTVTTTSGNDTWTSGTLYVYYDPLLEDIDAGTNLGTILTIAQGVRIIAAYDGTTLRDGIQEPIIDGANIIAGTVGATQVVTSGLITNTAQIVDGIISTAKIQDAAISGAKIGTATIGTLNLVNGSVTEVSITSIGDIQTSFVSGGAGSFGLGSGDLLIGHNVPSPTGVDGPFKTQIVASCQVYKNSSAECTIEMDATLLVNGVAVETQRYSINTNGRYNSPLFIFNTDAPKGAVLTATISYKFVLRQNASVQFTVGNRRALGITILR